MAYVGGVPVVDGEAVGLAVIGLFVSLLGLYVLGGIYVAARGRGLKSSQAAGLSSVIRGLLLIVAVVTKLLLSGSG